MKITAYSDLLAVLRAGGLTIGSTAGGDLTGTLPSPNVGGLGGIPIINAPDDDGLVLTSFGSNGPIGWAIPSNASTGSNSVTRTLGGQETIVTIAASGSSQTLDLGGGNVFDVTLTADCTLAFAGVPSGVNAAITLVLRQDGTGGWEVTWPGSVVWAGGAPTLSTTPGDADWVVLETLDGGTTWYGFPVGGGGSASPLTTKGDLWGYSTTDARVAVGADGTVLTATSGEATGVAWSTPAPSGIGEILISDSPSTPLVFADLLQNEAQDDLLYADP